MQKEMNSNISEKGNSKVESYVVGLKSELEFSLGGVAPRLAWNARTIEANEKIKSENDDEWMYLFADLSCVVIFYNVCFVIFNCGIKKGNLASIFIMLMAAFNIRLSFDECINRFALKFDKINYLIFSIGMFFMSLNAFAFKYSDSSFESTTGYSCNESGEQYFIGFAIGYLICKFGILLIQFRLIYIDEKGREQFLLDFIRHVLVCVVVALGIVAESALPNAFSNAEKLQYWAATILFEFLCSVYNTYLCATVTEKLSFGMWFGKERYIKIGYHYPLDIYRHQSRLGLFVMMILGEVLLEMGLPSYSLRLMGGVYLFDFFMIILAYSFAVQYYDCVHRPPGKPHAMQSTRIIYGFLFTWFHPLLGYFMLLMIVALTKMYEALHASNDVLRKYRSLLSVSCCLVCFLITFGRALHKEFKGVLGSTVYRIRFLFMCFHLLVMTSTLNFKYDVVMHAVIAVSLAIIDIIDKRVKESIEYNHFMRLSQNSLSNRVSRNFLLLNAFRTGFHFHSEPLSGRNSTISHSNSTISHSNSTISHSNSNSTHNPVLVSMPMKSIDNTRNPLTADSTDNITEDALKLQRMDNNTNNTNNNKIPDSNNNKIAISSNNIAPNTSPGIFTLHHQASLSDGAYSKRYSNRVKTASDN